MTLELVLALGQILRRLVLAGELLWVLALEWMTVPILASRWALLECYSEGQVQVAIPRQLAVEVQLVALGPLVRVPSQVQAPVQIGILGFH